MVQQEALSHLELHTFLLLKIEVKDKSRLCEELAVLKVEKTELKIDMETDYLDEEQLCINRINNHKNYHGGKYNCLLLRSFRKCRNDSVCVDQ